MGDSVDRLVFEADTSSKKRKGVHRPIFAPFFTQPAVDVPTPSKVHLLVNPYSGRKKGLSVGQEAERLLIEAGVIVETHHSEYAGHFVEITTSLNLSDGDCIAVVGGDGSLSESITGWMRTKQTVKPVFAVIPAGTGNSQGTELAISGVDDAVSRILRGRTPSNRSCRGESSFGQSQKSGTRDDLVQSQSCDLGVRSGFSCSSGEVTLDGPDTLRCRNCDDDACQSSPSCYIDY